MAESLTEKMSRRAFQARRRKSEQKFGGGNMGSICKGLQGKAWLVEAEPTSALPCMFMC